MPKKILIALPPAMLEKVDAIAEYEGRTRSDLVRESLRRYIQNVELYQRRKEPEPVLFPERELSPV
jgi:metal-responsive CopG/Arc/MetJ family transcriptional regulator